MEYDEQAIKNFMARMVGEFGAAIGPQSLVEILESLEFAGGRQQPPPVESESMRGIRLWKDNCQRRIRRKGCPQVDVRFCHPARIGSHLGASPPSLP